MNLGRAYFALQTLGGAAWWLAVAAIPFVRTATLGRLDPVAVAVLDVPLFVVASAVAAFGVRWAAWVATGWTGLVTIALAAYATFTSEAGWGVPLMAAAAGGSVLALCLVVRDAVPTAWIASGPFRFRTAAARATATPHIAATAAQIAVFWGFFLVVAPLILNTLERRWRIDLALPAVVPPLGVAVLVLASVLGIWSAATMSLRGDGTPLPVATANRLVIAGPYRFVRNPMALSGIAQGVAVGMLLSSWLVIVYALLGSMLWNFAVRPLEEADLEARFGDAFRRYRDGVRCWVPGPPFPSEALAPGLRAPIG